MAVHEKGGDLLDIVQGAPPFFDGRGQLNVSCRPSSSRPWLSSPLSVIPPFIWVCCGRTNGASVAAAWHAHSPPLLRARADETSITHYGWPQSAILIPDVDYGREHRSVKHNLCEKSKM